MRSGNEFEIVTKLRLPFLKSAGEEMMDKNKRVEQTSKSFGSPSQKNYNEIIEFLDNNWDHTRAGKDLTTIKKLDQALGSPSKDLDTILVSGTNGKSLTIHFTTKLLREDGLNVGAFMTPHILTYNERFSLNNEIISNKAFTDIANEVLSAAEANNISADTLELLTAMALLYFRKNNVDVALLEMSNRHAYDPISICKANVIGVSRITDDQIPASESTTLDQIVNYTLHAIQPGTHVVSADQSKHNLQVIQNAATERGGSWAMPIRKLAQLTYPYEQLHGRCAALAERLAQLYMDDYSKKNSVVASNSLLIKEKGQRGRPTLEAKRQSELNPKRTLEQFWQETINTLPGRFQVLDKEKPSLLLDNASNTDALKNLLLGVRLLHYQRPLKGLTFIFGCDKNKLNTEEFLKLLRYFTKKNSGQIIFCPIEPNLSGVSEESWDVEKVTNAVKGLKVKARSAANFEQAFDFAKKTVDERHGLVVITGSQSILMQYWKQKGMKKL